MITCMSDQAQAQEASLAQFSVDGHACYIVPQDASEATVGLRIIGSMTLGKRRYSICSDQPNASSAPTELLTSRELQIAVLIAQGFDRKAIGRRLGISAYTVTTHLRRTYFKLGVNSRRALAARIAGTVALHRRSANPTRTADQALLPS
jgi:Response regulator containing a CheY-like receiver domain and an HTH DNA-binding domain